MFRRRPVRVLALLAAALLLAGCGAAGGLESAGPTPSAVGPARLWPQLPPGKAAYEEDSAPVTEVVEGVDVPGHDLHRVDPLTIVKAEVAEHPAPYSGPDALPADTAAAIARCPAGKRPEQLVQGCPVLQAYYRDLTGNGKEELIVGIRYSDGSLGIRVYSTDAGRVVRIMSTSETVTAVELAGRDLIVHEPAQSRGYEIRYAWSWDQGQRAMLPARIEIVRTGPTDPTGSPSLSPAPSAAPTGPPQSSPAAERR